MSIFIWGKELVRDARRLFNVRAVPIKIVNYGESLKLTGQPAHWETKGGALIHHPNAYAKVGWSNMEHYSSTQEIIVPISCVLEKIKYNPWVIFAGEKFWLRKRSDLRLVERFLSKCERHVFAAPDKRNSLISAMFYILKNKIAFASVPSDYTNWTGAPSAATVIHGQNLKDAFMLLGFTPKETAYWYGQLKLITYIFNGKLFSYYDDIELTNYEAACWVRSNFCYPGDWLRAQFMSRLIPERTPLAVIRWVQAALKDSVRNQALYLQRKTANGEHVFSYINRIDEICPEDLTNGTKTGVITVFKNIKARQAKARRNQLKRGITPLAPKPNWWPGNTDEYRLLNTGAELIAEHEEMGHCVDTFKSKVRNRSSAIVSIRAANGDRSTVEFSVKTAEIKQHRAHHNSDPSDACKAIVEKLIKLSNSKLKMAA